MTPEQLEIARANAQRIVNAGGTDAIDYAVAVGFLSLIAQVEALTVPQGWKIVPLEPNQDMCEEGYYEFDPDGQPDAANLWRAMVKAAPTIPAIPGTKEGNGGYCDGGYCGHCPICCTHK